MKIVCQDAVAVSIFFFSYADLEGFELYAEKRYVHVMQEGAKEFLFNVPAPSVMCACQGVSVLSNYKRVWGKNIATDIPIISSDQRISLNNDDMNKLWHQGFDVDDDTLPNLEKYTESKPCCC